MDKKYIISQLKKQLLRDVAYLCNRDDRRWSQPIVQTLRDIRKANMRAVLFGGTLRSLLLSRLQYKRLGRPRDLDIVVAGANVETLREVFDPFIARETRFGGLQLQRMDWHFDVWPLHQTWAFVRDNKSQPHFASLPSTTFFNLEAIAIDIWARSGRSRTIYSGNDQFFEGLLSKTIEINRKDNPFPSLCVVRALIMASTTKFAIGPNLTRYILDNSKDMADTEFEETQRKHYGQVLYVASSLRKMIDHISRCYERNSSSSVRLTLGPQMVMWPDFEDYWTRINVHAFAD